MPSVIHRRQIVEDRWRLLPEAEDPPPEGDVIVGGAQLAQALALVRTGRLGVWLDSSAGPESIVPHLPALQLVAYRIGKFGDGRAFSHGRMLRERYGWRGELRAFGEVVRDQLLMLERCGYDSVVLRDGEDPRAALAAFAETPEHYQASVAEPRPLFRRRAA